jgi:hypothetical protein
MARTAIEESRDKASLLRIMEGNQYWAEDNVSLRIAGGLVVCSSGNVINPSAEDLHNILREDLMDREGFGPETAEEAIYDLLAVRPEDEADPFVVDYDLACKEARL